MSGLLLPRRSLAAILVAFAAAACDTTVTGPGADAEAVVTGQVSVSPLSGLTMGDDPSDVLVTVEGTAAADQTDGGGAFRVRARPDDGRLRLRFRRGALDARIELEGVTPGTVIDVRVELGVTGATVVDTQRGHHVEFEGRARFVTLRGSEPRRVLRVALVRDGRPIHVDIYEHRTVIERDGDLVTFEQILRGFEAELPIKIEGDGIRQGDGVLAAVSVEVEVEEHDRWIEFDGPARFVSLRGTEPARILRVSVRDDDHDRTLLVDIVENRTLIARDGDLPTFDDIVRGVQSDAVVELEGQGIRQDDGALGAARVRAEWDD